MENMVIDDRFLFFGSLFKYSGKENQAAEIYFGLPFCMSFQSIKCEICVKEFSGESVTKVYIIK